MEWETYKLDRRKTVDIAYEFFSVGRVGSIKKIVQFQQDDRLGQNVFNLAFGDFDENTNKFDDTVVTNNGDQLKVLHTVASAVMEFLRVKPSALVLIKGSTSSRTRLYQMRIAGILSGILQQFEILGERDNEWQPFQKGVNYKRFLILRKLK